MACYHPILLKDKMIQVPCGRCIGCRLWYKSQWAVRCMHEAAMSEENAFITLTYADEYLPRYGSLDRDAFPLFMKRLRKAISPRKARCFYAGEYGTSSKRPHYHALIFGFEFPDRYPWSIRGDYRVYRSAFLERLWPFGQSEIGSVTYASAAYVAGYILKKVKGRRRDISYDAETGEVVSVVPEFVGASRNPGIGKPWLDKYHCEVYPSDGVAVRGRIVKPPRYYDVKYAEVNPLVMESVRRKRDAARKVEDNLPRRLEAAEVVAEAKVNLYGKGRGL